MDIRAYFQKVREVEQGISTAWVFIQSLETSDGGKPGRICEVGREVAARLIVEGRARLATEAETAEYRSEVERRRVEAEQEKLAGKTQIAVFSEDTLRALKSSLKKG